MAMRDRWDAIAGDLRYAFRGLVREPLFTGLVVLTLALGIGANTTMYGVIDRLLLRGPDHVVAPANTSAVTRTGPQKFGFAGYALFLAIRDNVSALEQVAAYSSGPSIVGAGPDARNGSVAWVTASYFPLTGVRPIAGRFFSADEDRPGDPRQVAVISEGLSLRDFGGVAGAIGRTVMIDFKPYVVVGVARRGFTGVELTPVDVWAPQSMIRQSAWAYRARAVCAGHRGRERFVTDADARVGGVSVGRRGRPVLL